MRTKPVLGRPKSAVKQLRKRGWCGLVALILAAGACGTSQPLRTSTSTSRSVTLPIATFGPWGTTWSYNPYAAGFPALGYDFVYLPLAIQVPPRLADFIPQLATSWKAKGHQLTVRLRSGLRWQDNQRLTSRDVYDTVVLDGTNGGIWPDITNVRAPDARDVVFTLRPGVPAELAEGNILTMTPFPASVYGRFVTANLKHDEMVYYAAQASGSASANSSPQYKAISAAFGKLAAFHPKTMMGDGPYRLVSINTLEARLNRWDQFYGNGHNEVSHIDWLNGTTNQLVYPWLYSGRVAYGGVAMSPGVVQKWVHDPRHRLSQPPPAWQFAMEFNDRRYPLDLVKVRQALAYVLPRSKMTDLAYGHIDPGGTPSTVPDGLTPAVAKLYLSPKQLGQLNPYHLDRAKAASLLRAVGFHRRSGHWFLSNGHPFSLTVIVDSGESDVIASAEVAGAALKRFGINATVRAESGAAIGSALSSGDFDIGFNLPSSLDPLTEFDQMLGTANDFPSLAPGGSGRGMGYGPTRSVPGLGSVNVPKTIDHQSNTVPPGPSMRSLVWDWARLVNQQVPYLQYANKIGVVAYSSANFSWPNPKGKLWYLVSYNEGAGLILMLEQGKIRPRS